MATTQLKLSSMAILPTVILPVVVLSVRLKAKAGGAFLGKLGDVLLG